MKLASKAIMLTLGLLVFATVAFCQDHLEKADADSCAQNSFEEGAIAGRNDAKGNYIFALGGVIAGPVALVRAAVSHPQPSRQKVLLLEQTKGADFVSGYSTSFSEESRNHNLRFAAAGCVVNVTLLSVSYLILRDIGHSLR